MIVEFKNIGSDPEFAITDGEGKYLPSFLFFEGTKDHPEDMGGGFSILKDNLLVEGNIPPSDNKEEFIDSMGFLKEIINAGLSPHGAKLVCVDLAAYDEEFIDTPEGQEFGCQPSLNAYMHGECPAEQLRGLKRPAGMHVHIGLKYGRSVFKKHEVNECVVKAMDFFLGIPSDRIHSSPERRENYGKLGAYRKTSYGIEFRALGGFFAQQKYLGWIYDQTVKAIEFCNSAENMEKLMKVDSPSEYWYEFLGIKIEEQIKELKSI